MASISRYHGKVSKCTCGKADQPARESMRACSICFDRGFVAECMACDGKGQTTEKMAGGPGMMKSTCNACGGLGRFAVNKPEDWVEPAPPAPAETKTDEVAA